MLSLTPVLNDNTGVPLYIQLYNSIREAILRGHIQSGEKLPSLRALSKSLDLSVTTVQQAYNQLLLEGYIQSRPQSGYYINDISAEDVLKLPVEPPETKDEKRLGWTDFVPSCSYFDEAAFDFTRWRKCMNEVLTYRTEHLFQEGELQGEPSLRREISKYIYQVRGVRCTPEQIIISAGTQQLINLLCVLLQRMEIEHVCFEEPGYRPVQSIFKDRGFKCSGVLVDKDGIDIGRLPANIKSTVYVSPSNQFPTGSVMPIARRYALLEWAARNESIIIEDDYNSELRYFSRPVPSLQGLDNQGRVVYLGSFSSTLFPAVKISYMVLPPYMGKMFKESMSDYTQTCSKAEQMTLAIYMEEGFYQTNLRKLRKLYGQKIQLAVQEIARCGEGNLSILNHSSGMHMLLEVNSLDGLEQARQKGLPVYPVPDYPVNPGHPAILFYYTRIPMEKMREAVEDLAEAFQSSREPSGSSAANK